MKLTKVFLLCLVNVGADLIGWNRMTNNVSPKYHTVTKLDLNPRDELMRDLIKRGDFEGLNNFLQSIRRRQKLLQKVAKLE